MNVRYVVMHKKPHWDELFALWLARVIGGEEVFPGIMSAQPLYWDEMEGGAMTEEEYIRAGYLLIGIGFGRFDDKVHNGSRKPGKCSALLMAEALGITNEVQFAKLLKFSLTADTQPKVGFLDPADMVKILHNNNPENPQIATRYVFDTVDAYWVQEKRFFGEIQDEYSKMIRTVPGTYQRIRNGVIDDLNLVVLKTDSPDLVAFGRSDHGGRADVLIKFGDKTPNQIFFNSRYPKLSGPARDILRALRVEDGFDPRKWSWKELGQSGQLNDQDCWYGIARGEGIREQISVIANGTGTHKRCISKISQQRILEIVKMCLTRGFEPSRGECCNNNICSSSQGSPCPWFRLGLSRCQTVRFNQRREEATRQGEQRNQLEELLFPK